MTVNDGLEAIDRRSSKSGVGYSAPIVLHESKKQRITLIAFYIERQAGTDVALRLTCEERKAGVLWSEKASISLQNEAARKLYGALGARYAISEQGENGNFIVIPTTEGVVDMAELDGASVAKAVVQLLSENDIVQHLASQNLGAEIVEAFRGAIRLQELRNAVAELQSYLDNGEVLESKYQEWCNRHSWAFGNAYVARDEIRTITRADNVDLLMPSVLGGFRDVIELKRPDMTVLNWDSSHRNYYFSVDVSKAVGQSHRYLDLLHETAGNGLLDARDVISYHPRATIVIGRSHDWDDDRHRALRGLNARHNGITVMTYDHLLAQGQRMIDVLTGQHDEEVLVLPDEQSAANAPWDDDEPF